LTNDSPIRIAVIGSGPAGFYAAGHLLKDTDARVEVDMLERLPTPWGLVRFGVAPDHPKIKSVTRVYEKTAEHPRFRFFGNVHFGEHVSREDLLAHYQAIVYATGSPTDRALGIPGEDLPGSHPATEFVGWYNGHPDHTDLEFDLDSAERAVVIGNGNVALDVARMLCLTHAELAATDIADHALDVLEHSHIAEIVVVGRRGPAQASFTNPELLELGELSDADVIVEQAELDRALSVPDPASEADATSRRNVEILRSYAARPLEGRRKRIVLRFLLSPVALTGDEQGHLEAVELVRNELQPDPGGTLRAGATAQRETIPAGLLFRAIGYRGIPLPGVPFDERHGVIPSVNGRVTDPVTGAALPGEYVVGWIKRGPSGVIGTNKKDAQQTVDAILADVRVGQSETSASASGDADAVEAMLLARQPALVRYEGWSEIDRHERALGASSGRPRVKVTTIEEMLRIAAADGPQNEDLDEVEAG
jgi:ferredoxin/flavodoxin---NADP+ reductase